MFTLNMLSGPNGILKLNLVPRYKIHELCGWVNGHAIHKFAVVFINPLNTESPDNLYTSAAICVNASEIETILHNAGVPISVT